MAFCGKCGSQVAEGVAFCPQCGAPIGAAVPPPPSGTVNPPPPPVSGFGAAAPAASGLQPNVAACLSYVLGWLTGIIFLLIDKRPFVRFHAAQSIVVFGALHVIRLVLAFGILGGTGGLFSIWWTISSLISLVTLVLWIVLMIFAYQGKRYELPVVGPIARNIAGDTAV
jgi:uncharacterized membrane protein